MQTYYSRYLTFQTHDFDNDNDQKPTIATSSSNINQNTQINPVKVTPKIKIAPPKIQI